MVQFKNDDELPDVFGELEDSGKARQALERQQLADALATPATVEYLKRLLLRMGIASPLGASEAEAAMRNFALEMMREIANANDAAFRAMLADIFESQLLEVEKWEK